MRFPRAIVAFAVLTAAAPAAAQTPAGPEFVVEGASGNYVGMPAVATVPGGFVVAWLFPDGDGFGVMERRLDAAGAPVGPAFPVNAVTSGYQFAPRVAAAGNGDFVVSWLREGSLYAYGVFAR